MTTETTADARPEPAPASSLIVTRPRLRRGSAPRPGPIWFAALVVGCCAVLVRAVRLRTAYELHIDEVTYARIADSVATTGAVDLYGEPFFLHPPLVFLLEGQLLRWLGLDGSQLSVVLGLRAVPVVAAGLTAALLVVLVARVSRSLLAGVLAGVVFALDPFLVRQTSRNLLESPALLLVVASVTAAVLLVPDGGRGTRRRLPVELTVGVTAGLALLTKEPTAFVVGLPLLVAALTGWSLPRLSALRAGVVAVLVYAVYPAVVLAVGRGAAFSDQKLSGVRRLAGTQQDTGFNAGRGPTLAEAVLDSLPGFGPTYALLALSAPAVLLLLWKGDRRERWVATWTGCAQLLMAYLVLLGTLEEQFFSYLVVPSVVATTCAVALVVRAGGARRTAAQALTGVALVAFAGIAGTAWAQAHLQRHDGYAQAIAALRASAPCGATVSATAEPLPFVLDGYRIVEVGRLVGPRRDAVEWVMTSSKQVSDGFGAADERTLADLARTAEPVFTSTESDGAGRVVLWRLDGAVGGTCPVSPSR